MQDYFDLANEGLSVQKFFCKGSIDEQSWKKPMGARTIFIFCLGGGAGGGGGRSRTAGSAGGGGGGGGSAGLARLCVAADLLPDELWIRVGTGGAGGAFNTAGSNGEHSVIKTVVNGGSDSIILSSSVGDSTGGGAGTTSGAGAGGAAAVIATSDNCIFSCLGTFVPFAGQAGSNGGVHTGAAGTALTWGTLIVSGGAGGGGTTSADFAGGSVSVATSLPISTANGGAAGSNAGNSGTTIWKPFCSTGGAGGGASNSGAGGFGGNGGLGCGGGGGGAGTTGGTGGRGGDGYVLIVAI